jgi:hypothetical protein
LNEVGRREEEGGGRRAKGGRIGQARRKEELEEF